MRATVTIPTNSNRFYKQYLIILNPLLGKNTLRLKEIELLANFYEEYDSYNGMTDDQKSSLLFHKNTVKKIIIKMDLSRPNYDNLTHSLRKKGFIINDSVTGASILNPVFIISKAANQTLTLKFQINDSQ